VELAKQYGGGPSFGSFTNALLRKLPPDPSTITTDNSDGQQEQEQQQQQQQQRSLVFTAEEGDESDTRPLPSPKGDSEEALAIRLSYPPFLVHLLIEGFGKTQAKTIMEAGNTFPPTMVRSRAADAAVPTVLLSVSEEEAAATAAAATATAATAAAAATTTATGAAVPVAAGLASKPVKLPWETVKSLPLALKAPLPLPYTLGVVRSEKLLRKLTQDEGWYVTNGTPAGLLARLAQGAVARVLGGGEGGREGGLRVLDVCAAPGGKGLAVWDVIKKEQGYGALSLVMNDVNEEKIGRIRENLSKFGLEEEVELTIGDGLTLTREEVVRQMRTKKEEEGGKEDGFDVVILDAPCSNAGVLGRRPEARWRLRDDKLLKELEETQFSLLKHASDELLSRTNSRAEIWYMTCSILKGEDEGMVERACRELGLEVVMEGGREGRALQMKVLPGEGPGGAFDGGFGCALRRSS
jgi:16S rRNA C967 or C1407 C5-methylase (RsmB/RsmF family)